MFNFVRIYSGVSKALNFNATTSFPAIFKSTSDKREVMTQRYEVQTKFIYGFENVWRDEDDKLIYFDTRKQAIKELRENVDDWNNDPNTTSKYYYNDYRVRRKQ